MVSGWILRGFVAVAVLAATVVPGTRAEATPTRVVTPGAAGVDAGCPARDTRVDAPYAITGYWLVSRSDWCVTRRTVEAIHGVGGDTLITFGPRLVPSRVHRAGRLLKEGAPDPDFTGCVENGKTCYQAAGRRFRASEGSTAMRRTSCSATACCGVRAWTGGSRAASGSTTGCCWARPAPAARTTSS